MASFFRKKQKTAEPETAPISTATPVLPPLSGGGPMTPLFAKFTSSAASPTSPAREVSGPIRLVSSPMQLSSRGNSPTKLSKPSNRQSQSGFRDTTNGGPSASPVAKVQAKPRLIAVAAAKPLPQGPDPRELQQRLGPQTPSSASKPSGSKRESQPPPARQNPQDYAPLARSPSHAAPYRADFSSSRSPSNVVQQPMYDYNHSQPRPSSRTTSREQQQQQAPRASSRAPHPPTAHHTDFYQQPAIHHSPGQHLPPGSPARQGSNSGHESQRPPSRPSSRQEMHRPSSRQETQRPPSRQSRQQEITRVPSRQDVRTQDGCRAPSRSAQDPQPYQQFSTDSAPPAAYHEPRGHQPQYEGYNYVDGAQQQWVDPGRRLSRTIDSSHIQRTPSAGANRTPHPPPPRTPSRQAIQYDSIAPVSAYRGPLPTDHHQQPSRILSSKSSFSNPSRRDPSYPQQQHYPEPSSHLPSPPTAVDNDMGRSYMSQDAPIKPGVTASRGVSQRMPSRGKPLIFAAMSVEESMPVQGPVPQQPQQYTRSPPSAQQQQFMQSPPLASYRPMQQPYAPPPQQTYPTPPLSYDTMPEAYRANLAGGFVSPRSPARSNSTAVPQGSPTRKMAKRMSHQPESNTITVPLQPPAVPSSPRVLVKASRPTTPVSIDKKQKRKSTVPSTSNTTATDEDMEPMLDDDPFAKADPVMVVGRSGTSVSASSEGGHDHTAVTTPSLPSPSPKRVVQFPPTPVSPAEYQQARSDRVRRGDKLGVTLPPLVSEVIARQKRHFPLAQFLAEPKFLTMMLDYGAFWEYAVLASVDKEIRGLFEGDRNARECVLERFLPGYKRWGRDETAEPFSLSAKDLSDYMRGVCLPDNQYSRHGKDSLRTPSAKLDQLALELAASTRAYTRVVLRLRAQAEAEEKAFMAAAKNSGPPPSSSRMNSHGTPSRPPSPTFSSTSHGHGNGRQQSMTRTRGSPPPMRSFSSFQSPLFKSRRAPLLRVFVPSDRDWLSDEGVLACEEELKRAGVFKTLRVGDVIWDVAIGDEGNLGRMVWDGQYLIDLDYTFTPVGDVPHYLHTLAFPPSYFHRVIRTGPASTNPIVHMDISPWGDEVATNLQLLQDRVRTETPQGAFHNLVRWVHRSSFVIRQPRGGPGKIPIPNSEFFVDPGWFGTVVVEAEGTNEGLADLQDRCPAVFPPRPQGMLPKVDGAERVFRILREKSRPGEIWIRTVRTKERIL